MGHVAGEAALAGNGRIQVMQALIEGFGKRPQFAGKVRSDPRNWPIRTQVGQLHADALQHDYDASNHEQRQACGQERRQHDTAQEREVDAPLGLIPIPTFCCHNQQSRFLTSYRHARRQRAARVAVREYHVVVAWGALLHRSKRQLGPSTAGRTQQGSVGLRIEDREELGMPARLVFRHEAFELSRIQLLQHAPHRR